MAYVCSPQHCYQKNLSREKNSSDPSLVVHVNKFDIVPKVLNDYTYRTEVYLQQREKQNIDKTSSSSTSATITTWKILKYQKEMLKNDQAEIDRALSTIDSIHEIFNRSASIPYNQVYSSLYGDNNKSDHLMKTFCRCQNHFRKEDDDNHIQTISSSFVNFEDTDSDLDYNEDEEEKKKTYDSGYETFKLIPIDVDLHTQKNMEEHSTNHYDIPGLVLRRGQSFSFTVTFNKDYDIEQNQLYIRLAIGPRSMISKRTQIRLLVDGTPSGNGWSAKSIPIEDDDVKTKKKNCISLQINSPSDAIIGKYTLLLEVCPSKNDDKKFLNKQDPTLFLIEADLYFLFNPWNKDDACALSSSEQINEYVMNEHGQIYLGTSNKPQPIPWYFGQFERSTLLTALTLLDKAKLPAQNRIDPSIIIRILSSKICSNPGTNNGIFPSSYDTKVYSSENHGYTSSTGIFKQYLLSNCRSVQGGCGNNWQHAAILCSLSRSLGIPCRIVTIYNAACQTDGTEDNDTHWDTKQRPLHKLNFDLICSSHVWNECWMRRHDLPNDEQDWQIVDSTPVQMCDGIRRTGPCSVSSLKNDKLSFRWDSPFIHSTINGKKSHWIVYPDGHMELLDVQENIVGTKIITRSLDNEFEPSDITKNYKNLMKTYNKYDNITERINNDVDIELKIPDNIEFGDDITFELNANNKSNEIRTIATALTISILSNNDQKLIVSHDQPVQTLNLEAEKNDHIQLKVTSKQYASYGKQENIILKYYIHSLIKETDQTFTRDDNIVFNKYDIIKPILDDDVIEIGKPVLLKILIANTLSHPINSGQIYIDGLGINQIVHVNRSFAPKESTTLHIKLYPTRIGVSRLYVTFISNNVSSSTQTIPLEIIREPIKQQHERINAQEEPLLTTNTETSAETDEKIEIPSKEDKLVTQSNISDRQDETLIHEEEQHPLVQSPSSLSSSINIADEYQDDRTSNISQPKFELSTTEDDDDDIAELNLKKNQDESSPNPNTSSSLPHDSTLSLEKDKISVDSLDIAHDRRYGTNNNQ
ncbi:unnamed protein product [Rotaria sp. Silwood1]|nr:unnamed protein product [Rotaria sp. Silwood1]